jgi:hydroxymethylpyrimidine pyrophosphatase-like HAD family hydrolase/DNA-binding MurR/RpiR family transcriptional regulator
MGKPFKKELEKVFDVYDWASSQPTEHIRKFFTEKSSDGFYAVGSGGSLSACYYAAALMQDYGIISKAITPLEVYYAKKTLRNSNLLFISASGKNNDILFGLKNAIQCEPSSIGSICMRKGSPLAKLSQQYSSTEMFEFAIPTGKDGFLATNSLVAFFTLLYKSLGSSSKEVLKLDNRFPKLLDEFFDKISPEHTFTVLYGGWGHPVAIDIESKFTEAALAPVLLSDYRNFGHGRHHWFAKRKKSAIVALVTPHEKELAQKTLALLPKNIPVLVISSNHASALASIELLMKSLYVTDRMGEVQGIDPGRPGVPGFGSKMYNLRYATLLPSNDSALPQNIASAIIRKASVNHVSDFNKDELTYWENAYHEFTKKLKSAKFGTVVFDYDGTLCKLTHRKEGIADDMIYELNQVLKKGFIVGIVTGRGQSVRSDMQKAIPDQRYWKNIVIGYYNGAEIGTLDENDLPSLEHKPNESLVALKTILDSYPFVAKPDIEIRPSLLKVEVEDRKEWRRVRNTVVQVIMRSGYSDVQILESSHSMDIIPRPRVTKVNILKVCSKKAKSMKLPEACLCIGDKGQWPGNDYELLSTPYSLSVDEVSPEPDRCWNLAGTGIKNDKATLQYLRSLEFKKNFIRFLMR